MLGDVAGEVFAVVLSEDEFEFVVVWGDDAFAFAFEGGGEEEDEGA